MKITCGHCQGKGYREVAEPPQHRPRYSRRWRGQLAITCYETRQRLGWSKEKMAQELGVSLGAYSMMESAAKHAMRFGITPTDTKPAIIQRWATALAAIRAEYGINTRPSNYHRN